MTWLAACTGEKKVHTFFWFKNLKKVTYENLSTNEGNIKTELKKETWWKSVAGIHLSLAMDKWQVILIVVMNLWIPSNAGNFLSN